jgi:3-hydroxybutyryl-CoA dehydrogenase
VRVAVLGCGVMGVNIARTFLRAGSDVALYSRSTATLERARAALAGERALAGAHTDLAEAVGGAALAIESVPEQEPLKLALLAAAEDAAGADAVIATNTSSLSVDGLSRALQRPARFLGLHWFNPAHLIPLVEVVPCADTDPGVSEWCVQVLADAGKRPLVLRRAVPGFVANRLQYALIREALALLEAGVAEAESIDAALTDCLGPRWSVIGPLRSTDLAGIDTAVAVARELYPSLSAQREVSERLLALQRTGRLGARSGEGFYRYDDPEAAARARDEGLAAVLYATRESRRDAGSGAGSSSQ